MMPSYIKYMQKPRNDEWYTPVYGVLPIIKYIQDNYPPAKTVVWCPFDGKNSNYVLELKKTGYKVVASHKNEKKDFLTWTPKCKWDIIVSNPPFSIKNEVLKRAYQLKKPFALLLPLSALEGVFRNKLYIKNGIELIKFDRRISFNKTRGISFATGYFCWKVLNETNKLVHETLDSVQVIKSGKGGAHTKTGGIFENIVDLKKLFANSEDYELVRVEKDYYGIKYKREKVGFLFKKHGLYRYLERLGGGGWHYRDYLSKRILPDSAVFVLTHNTLNVIEIKYQNVAGSVDEKLQTCDFKRRQYQKLVKSLNWNVEYIYVLNDWFKKPEYKDTLEYIRQVKCHYYFNALPLTKIGLFSLKD